MAAGEAPLLQKQFPLDPRILGPNSAASLVVSASTDADVLQSILNNTAFPERPNGQLGLGSIVFQASGGNQVTFAAGPAQNVSFNFSTSFKTGTGVFDRAADALASLGLDSAQNLDLTIPGDASSRYLLMLVGYQASGSISGSHPIGVLGSLTFGAQASGDGLYAVLHRFPGATGADTALGDTVSSWRLPRQVSQANNLKPGTWIVVQANGSIAIQLAAQLGYDFSFVRQANLLGIPRSLGAKIDAGVKATFGFNASGKYLVIVGRETDASVVRLRLFKQADQGFNFGLNVNVGITGHADLPPTIDDFVKAVFGVHGLQVLNDLHLIEQWKDSTKDLGDTIARLVNKTGLDLLTKATGIDAGTQFDKARQMVLNAFQQWDVLPDRASAALWKILGNAGPVDTANFKTFLTALANPDPQTRSQALAQAITQVAFGEPPQGQWLESIADQGLLALSNQLDLVQGLASQTLNILNGGIIKNIQDFINQHLDLTQVEKVVTQDDFNKVDEWLISRLSDFLDQKLDLPALKQVQTAISTLIGKASDIYAKALAALNNKYSLDFAATYQRNTTSAALLDVNFDLSIPRASAMLHDVVANSNLDALLVTEVPGVTLNQAALSHEIKRNADVQVQMPFFDSNVQHVNDSLATLTDEHDSGRVLAYQIGATDTITSANRYQSQLSVLGKLEVVNGALQLGSLTESSVAYQSLQVKAGITLAELELRTMPFLDSLLANVFPDGASFDRFYMALDQTISNINGNRNNDFGDVALNFQVALPAAILSAWFKRLDASGIKNASMMMSLALQANLKSLIPFFFFQDLNNLNPNSPAVAALLVWAAMPQSTSIDFEGGHINQFNTNTDVFWNWPDPDLRHAVALDPHTTASLAPLIQTAHDRWVDAGNKDTAKRFTNPGVFQNAAVKQGLGEGDVFLHSLLQTEAEMVRGAASALQDVQDALSVLNTAPSKAIVRLAKFGADLSGTFNKNLSIYSSAEVVRTLNSMLLVEASRSLDSTVLSTPPAAMLSLIVLANGHSFQLSDYLSGKVPPRAQVAVAQTLTNLT
jgi:hypothetical protein